MNLSRIYEEIKYYIRRIFHLVVWIFVFCELFQLLNSLRTDLENQTLLVKMMEDKKQYFID